MDDEQERREEEAGRARRGALEATFLEALLGHLEGPSDATWGALMHAADGLSAVGGDHFSYGISWAREIDTRIGPLLAGDPPTWGFLLQGLGRRARGPDDDFAARFSDASPFRGRLVIYAQSRSGYAPTYHGDIDPLVEQALVGHLPITLSPHETMFVLDRPAPVTATLQPDDDTGSVGC